MQLLTQPLPPSAPSVADALGPPLDDAPDRCDYMRLSSGVTKAISLSVFSVLDPEYGEILNTEGKHVS